MLRKIIQILCPHFTEKRIVYYPLNMEVVECQFCKVQHLQCGYYPFIGFRVKWSFEMVKAFSKQFPDVDLIKGIEPKD